MKGQKLRLPRDLRGHVRWAVIKKIMPFVLLMIAFGAVLYLWGERIFVILPPIARIGAYILTMLIPFAITRFPFCLFDQTFTGTVKGVHVKNEYTMEKKEQFSFSYTSRRLIQAAYLDIEEPYGNTREVKIMMNNNALAEEFKPGDTLFHLYGAKHTVILPEAAGDHVECPVCGDDNRAELTACHSCGHTLIKSMHDLI
jgi:hypothetical protein